MDIKLELVAPSTSNANGISSKMTVEVCKEETNDVIAEDETVDSDLVIPSYPDSFHIKEELDPVFICDVCGLTVDGEEELKDHVVSAHVAMTTVKRGLETKDGRGVIGVSNDGVGEAKPSAEPTEVMCESCGRCFGRERDFKKHFRAKHFVKTKFVEKVLEIPPRASASLRRKVDSLAEDMAARRREHLRVCVGKDHSFACFGRTIDDEIGSNLKDIGRMMKQEFPAYKCGQERKNMAAYIAFRLHCGTDQLKRYLSGRWNNPLLIDPMDIQAMRERLKQQVTTAMPDVIANHKSKTQRLSGRNVAPVQSFKWSISTKQTFKQLVDMHLRNMRFDVDVRFDADEKEMKARVETYLAKLIKSLVSVWPSGWMSERVLMNDCRSTTREFLKSLKEKQSEFYEDLYATEDSIPGSAFIDADDELADNCEQVLLESTPDADLAASSSSLAEEEDEEESLDGVRTKFVWARRVTLVKGYGRQMRMCLLPLGARALSSNLTSLKDQLSTQTYGMFRKKVKADWVFNGSKRPIKEVVEDESKRLKVESTSAKPIDSLEGEVEEIE